MRHAMSLDMRPTLECMTLSGRGYQACMFRLSLRHQELAPHLFAKNW